MSRQYDEQVSREQNRLHKQDQHSNDIRDAGRGGIRGLLALQRTAGNRAVAGLLTAQRCGAGHENEEHAPAQGVAGREDEFAPVEQRLAVQRAATFTAGPVHQVNNLASAVIHGTPVGITWPLLNGTKFLTTAVVRANLRHPTITTTATPAPGSGFDAKVTAVPSNTGSYDETVLAAGPWTQVVGKSTIGGMFPSLTMCSGGGSTTFRAIGNPSDAHMFQANRRHENHHASDHRVAFNQTVKPWDTKLTNAKNTGRKFHGATAAAAEAALHAAMGGKPDTIADRFLAKVVARATAFHATAAGGPVGAPTSPTANPGCTTSSAKYKNPS